MRVRWASLAHAEELLAQLSSRRGHTLFVTSLRRRVIAGALTPPATTMGHALASCIRGIPLSDDCPSAALAMCRMRSCSASACHRTATCMPRHRRAPSNKVERSACERMIMRIMCRHPQGACRGSSTRPQHEARTHGRTIKLSARFRSMAFSSASHGLRHRTRIIPQDHDARLCLMVSKLGTRPT